MFPCNFPIQPAPLTGTATHRPSARRAYRSDAARTPHGDSNALCWAKSQRNRMQPAPLTGTATCRVHPAQCPDMMQPAPLTGTATLALPLERLCYTRCSPRPSRGQQRTRPRRCYRSVRDAARTPHGDSNVAVPCRRLLIFRDAARTPHGDKKGGVTQGSV